MAWFKKKYCGRSYSPPYSNTDLFIFCIRERMRWHCCAQDEKAVQYTAEVFAAGCFIGAIPVIWLYVTSIASPLQCLLFPIAIILSATIFGLLAILTDAFVFAMSKTDQWSKPRYTYKLIQSYKFR